MNKTAIQYQTTVHDLPMPQGNGTFTIYDDGAIVGNPESSAIHQFTYLPHTQCLVIEYVGNSEHYYYDDVPAYKVFQMLASESIGAFVAKAIKPHHLVWTPEPR
jgi:hypothetical protein